MKKHRLQVDVTVDEGKLGEGGEPQDWADLGDLIEAANDGAIVESDVSYIAHSFEPTPIEDES